MTLWYPGVTRRVGPAWKNRGSTNPATGVVFHSAEGWWGGLQYELDRDDRGAAWHFSCLTNGHLIQHYPLNAVLHHAGDWGGDQDGADGNGECIGIEFEGVKGQQLTVAQIQSATAFVWWLGKRSNFVPTRTAVGRNLFEHKELSDLATACPSNRVPWPVVMREFDRMAEAERPKPSPPPATTLSPVLDPNNPQVWYAVYDAVVGGTEGEYERLPKTHPTWSEYKFRLKVK